MCEDFFGVLGVLLGVPLGTPKLIICTYGDYAAKIFKNFGNLLLSPEDSTEDHTMLVLRVRKESIGLRIFTGVENFVNVLLMLTYDLGYLLTSTLRIHFPIPFAIMMAWAWYHFWSLLKWHHTDRHVCVQAQCKYGMGFQDMGVTEGQRRFGPVNHFNGFVADDGYVNRVR